MVRRRDRPADRVADAAAPRFVSAWPRGDTPSMRPHGGAATSFYAIPRSRRGAFSTRDPAAARRLRRDPAAAPQPVPTRIPRRRAVHARRRRNVFCDATPARPSRTAPVRARGVDTVLVADHFPELGADLVAALAALDVDDLTHGCCWITCGARAWARCGLAAGGRHLSGVRDIVFRRTPFRDPIGPPLANRLPRRVYLGPRPARGGVCESAQWLLTLARQDRLGCQNLKIGAPAG